jgi:hypothetical protein
MLTSINTLPDSSRIWIFAAERKLSTEEISELLNILDEYLTHWKAHQVPVQAARDIRYDQFVIIAANPDVTAPSGCSIDDMTRAMKSLGEKFKVDFFGALKVFYRDGENIIVTDRATFKSKYRSGEIDEETIVFDNSLTSLADFRAGKWELPAGESWHKSMLHREAVGVA